MKKNLKKICILSLCLFIATGCSINDKDDSRSKQSPSTSTSESKSNKTKGMKVTYTNVSDKASRDLWLIYSTRPVFQRIDRRCSLTILTSLTLVLIISL